MGAIPIFVNYMIVKFQQIPLDGKPSYDKIMMLGLAQIAKNHPGDRFLITGTAPRMEPTEIIEPREGKALYTCILYNVYMVPSCWFFTALPPL